MLNKVLLTGTVSEVTHKEYGDNLLYSFKINGSNFYDGKETPISIKCSMFSKKLLNIDANKTYVAEGSLKSVRAAKSLTGPEMIMVNIYSLSQV